MAATAGQIAKSHNIEIISRTVASTITVGDLVSFDTSGKPRTCAVTAITSNITNGFGVALETVTSGKARIAVGNTWVYCTSSTGATLPFQTVAPTTSESVAGRVRALSLTTETATGITGALWVAAGRYMGHEDEADDPSAATTAEVIIVRLGL
jgi:hypothetical protein